MHAFLLYRFECIGIGLKIAEGKKKYYFDYLESWEHVTRVQNIDPSQINYI